MLLGSGGRCQESAEPSLGCGADLLKRADARRSRAVADRASERSAGDFLRLVWRVDHILLQSKSSTSFR